VIEADARNLRHAEFFGGEPASASADDDVVFAADADRDAEAVQLDRIYQVLNLIAGMRFGVPMVRLDVVDF